jgi:hypothetical protein
VSCGIGRSVFDCSQVQDELEKGDQGEHDFADGEATGEKQEVEATGEKQYGCEFDCGYTGSFSDVEVHEATCPFSSLYLPASTWSNITCRMTCMM